MGVEGNGSRDWQEFPIYVPYGQDHLSAVITAPRGDIRGLVLLMSGYGAPRSHRFQMWARAARRLAQEQRLASIRFDYVGFGDATGLVLQWGWGEDISAAKQAETVARAGMELVGVDRYMAVANCTGGASAVRLAADMSECIGAVSLLMPVLIPPTKGVKARLRKSRLANFVRYNRFLRERIGRRLMKMIRRSDTEVAYRLARSALGHSKLLFVYGEHDWLYNEKVEATFERTLQRLPEDYRTRFELKVFPGIRLLEFESVPIQEMTIETVLGWAGVCFPPSPSVPAQQEARTEVRIPK